MHIFSKHCYCRRASIPFRSTGVFDEHAIANVFCPVCSDRAPGEGFMVAVTGVPGWSGMYGIDWNQSFLSERDSAFKDSERYYKKLFESGGVTFGFLPKARDIRSYDVMGIKRGLPSEALPDSRAGRIESEDEESRDGSKKSAVASTRSVKNRPRGLGR